MVWHYNGCVKVVAFAVVVKAMVEDGVSGFWGKLNSIRLAEGDEYCSPCFLIVREHTAVFVFAFERWSGHVFGHVASACNVRSKIKSKVESKIKSKVKGVGQECPTHTGTSHPRIAFVCSLCL